MKTFAGIALGFALMPATLGLIGTFAWTGIHFELSRTDTVLGAALGIVTLIIAAAVGFKYLAS